MHTYIILELCNLWAYKNSYVHKYVEFNFVYNNTVQINFVMGTFLFYGKYHCCNRKHREYVIQEKEKQKAEICFYSCNEIDHLYMCSFNLYEEKFCSIMLILCH